MAMLREKMNSYCLFVVVSYYCIIIFVLIRWFLENWKSQVHFRFLNQEFKI